MRMLLIVATAVLFPTLADAALFFSEDFNSGSLGPDVTDPDSAYVFTGGVARRSSGGPEDRHYIETVATNYNTVNFIAEITFTLTNTGNGNSNIIFFGLGSALPDGTYHNESGDAIYFRIHALDDPNPPFRGAADVASNPVGNAFSDVTYFSGGNLLTPNSTHRARIEKVGNTISFSVDENFNGAFASDFTIDIPDLTATAPFLNNSNSRLFFGTALPLDSFDNFTVVQLATVPEPSSVLIWSGISAAFIFMRRRGSHRTSSLTRCERF